MRDGKEYYKITKLKSKMKYVYFINKKNSSIDTILTYKKGTLLKEISIKKIIKKGKNTLITEWTINDFKKNKKLAYFIDEKSITSKTKASMFHKNRLEKCTF